MGSLVESVVRIVGAGEGAVGDEVSVTGAPVDPCLSDEGAGVDAPSDTVGHRTVETRTSVKCGAHVWDLNESVSRVPVPVHRPIPRGV